MALVAVEPARVRLVTVAGLGVDHRDDPIRRHPVGDDEAAVGGLLDVLADDGGQQLGRLGDLGTEPLAAERTQGPVAVAEQRIHQLFPGGWVVPVADRLACLLIIVITLERRAHRRGQLRRTRPQHPPDRPRSSVTVSWVATASYSGAESSTRRTPTRPAWRASSQVTRKTRSGSAEARTRARSSTSTVCTNPGISSSTPAAYRQRRS
jgi:hypothetical protein